MKRQLGLGLLLFVLSACGKQAAPPRSGEAAAEPGPLAEARVVSRTTSSPVVELRVVFRAGSVDDPADRAGLTFVTAVSMAEGGAGGRSFAERERLLFPMAAGIDVQVEREQVVFSGRAHRDHWAAFYPLFREVLLEPSFESADVERIVSRTTSQLTQDLRGSSDEDLGKELLQAMLYEEHPYAHPILGTETGLAAITPEDLKRQRARVLCEGRVEVAMSGPIDAEQLALLRADLGRLPRADCRAPDTLPLPRSLSGRRMWLVEKPEAQSVALSMGLPLAVTRAHPDYAALTLASAYLGQHRTFAGRLMQKVRGERGLNYGDYAYAEHFQQDGGSRFPQTNVARRQQYFSIWLRPVPVDKAHFALRMAVRELDTFVQEGLTQADFERIQQFAQRYFALFAQTEQARLGHILDQRFYDLDGPYIETLCAQLGKLTRAEVNAAIKRHLDPALLQIAVVAPRASDFAKAVVSEAASPITYTSEKPAEVLSEDQAVAIYPVGVAAAAVRVWPLETVFR